MAQVTTLSVLATPGRTTSFIAKAVAVIPVVLAHMTIVVLPIVDTVRVGSMVDTVIVLPEADTVRILA